MPNVVLHQWDMAPYCNKVRRMLRHTGVAYSVTNYNGRIAGETGSSRRK